MMLGVDESIVTHIGTGLKCKVWHVVVKGVRHFTFDPSLTRGWDRDINIADKLCEKLCLNRVVVFNPKTKRLNLVKLITSILDG